MVNSRTRFGLQIVFVCLYSTPSHHLCANWSEDTELIYACQIYFVEYVCKIKRILSVIHYTLHICGAVCFQFAHSPCDDWDNLYTLFYNHHKKGSMNSYQWFRVSSWKNGMHCASFYILMNPMNWTCNKTSVSVLLIRSILRAENVHGCFSGSAVF